MGGGAQLTRSVDPLIQAAIAAAHHAYAPYSGYHVGAALLMVDGSIITGANFENASYGMTLCAETVAIASANSMGRMTEIVAIAVVGGPKAIHGGAIISAAAVTPCGRCRQIIKEVADVTARDIPIHCVHDHGYDTHLISELLPHGFGPANLK
jgi:cytidine deaminase